MVTSKELKTHDVVFLELYGDYMPVKIISVGDIIIHYQLTSKVLPGSIAKTTPMTRYYHDPLLPLDPLLYRTMIRSSFLSLSPASVHLIFPIHLADLIWEYSLKIWNQFEVNDLVDGQDIAEKWYEVRIREVKMEEESVFVHYRGFPQRWDEWISMKSERLAPLGTHTTNLEKTQIREESRRKQKREEESLTQRTVMNSLKVNKKRKGV